MRIPLYQVDAFADRAFAGNPAAVCPLSSWPEDALLQAIAAENNLSETAFFVAREDGSYDLRWFAPIGEVDLCGHATLATGYILRHRLGVKTDTLRFTSRSGLLEVRCDDTGYVLDFPAQPVAPAPAPSLLVEGLALTPVDVVAGMDWIAVVESEEQVLGVRPDLAVLARLDRRGVCVTAPGRNHDFVSRFFAPKYGIPEDPVTGSAHCALAPYWCARLGRATLDARQLSARGGDLRCEVRGDRVLLGGGAVLFFEGMIELPG